MASRPNKTAAKRYNRVAQALAKNLAVVFVAGCNNGLHKIWDLKLGREIKASRAMADALSNGCYKWMIHCAVTGRRQDGQQYMKLEYLAAPQPLMQRQIAVSCNELHKELLGGFNKMHQLTAAWIGVPSGIELEPSVIDSIITKCGAFDFKAQWEVIS